MLDDLKMMMGETSHPREAPIFEWRSKKKCSSVLVSTDVTSVKHNTPQRRRLPDRDGNRPPRLATRAGRLRAPLSSYLALCLPHLATL